MDAVVQQLRERLQTLAPELLEIDDQSAQHAGHAGAREGGRHFSVRIVSSRFSGLSMLARHRLVYAAAGDLMSGPIHALAIAATPPQP
jgi:BolA family transcriptional regulator, general stress-responsive regulator